MRNIQRKIMQLLVVICLAGPGAASGQSSEWASLKPRLTAMNASWNSIPQGIVTTKLTTGMLLGNGDIGVVAGDSVNRQTFYFGKSDFWGAAVKNPHEAADAVWQESVLSLGGLTIRPVENSEHPAQVFRMEQDMVQAEVRTTMQLGNAIVKMVSWTADADGSNKNNFFITRLLSDKAVFIDATLWLPSTYKEAGKTLDCAAVYPYQSGVSNGLLWTVRENYNNPRSDHTGNYKVRAAMAVKLIGASFSNPSTGKAEASGRCMLPAGSPVYIIVAFSSAAATGDKCPAATIVKDSALGKANSLNAAQLARLTAAHKSWWKDYWLKSYVDLGDPVFDHFYYGALYMLGSSTRAGNPPPSLFGNWITTDLSAWGGRFFLNYNEQAALYGVYAANRPELAIPYIDLILKEMPWQRNKTHAAGFEGVCHQRSITPYHLVSAAPDPVPVAAVKDYKKLPTDQKSNGMFVAMPLIWYYEYTQDVHYLQDTLYPYLLQLDAFYRSYISRDRKPYIVEHSSAHEGSDDINPNLDIGFIKRLSKFLIASAKILQRDTAMIPVWQDMLDNLSDYPTIVRNDKTVYVEAAIKNGGTEKLFHEGCQPVNMEGAVYPGENIYVGGNEKELETARESLRQLGGWCVNTGGSEHNGFPKHWPVAARIGWPADDLYKRFKEAIQFHWRASNLTAFQGGGGIETAGAIEGIHSMLMQSEGGTIRLFPVWPTTKDASFKRLRAKGAFLVSARQTNGQTGVITITSETGNELRLENPWKGKKINAVEIDGSRKTTVVLLQDGPQIVFKTKAGHTYQVSRM